MVDKGMASLHSSNNKWPTEMVVAKRNVAFRQYNENSQFTSPKAKNNFYVFLPLIFELFKLFWSIFRANFLSTFSFEPWEKKENQNRMKWNWIFYTHLFLLCFKTINKIRRSSRITDTSNGLHEKSNIELEKKLPRRKNV